MPSFVGKKNLKPVLIEQFKISEIQAEAILELKLRHLAKLEEVKIKSEAEELGKERKSIELLTFK